MIQENLVTSTTADTTHQFIARIFNSRGRVVGTGFITSSKRLLTPRHVIQTAIGVMTNRQPSVLEIVFDLPLLAPGEKKSAFLSSSIEDFDERGYFKAGHDSVDVALLTIKDPIPFVRCNIAFLPTVELMEHEFWVYGFPKNFENEGAAVTGKITSPRPSGLVQLQEKERTGLFIQQGFSGAPVWDMKVNAVVAMVVSVAEEEKIAVALSLEKIIEKFPILAADAIYSLWKNYKTSFEPLIDNQENQVASPLDGCWDDFHAYEPWHNRVLQEIQFIKWGANRFKGFEILLNGLSDFSPDSSYPKLYADLQKLYTKEASEQIHQALRRQKNELEKRTKTSAYAARRKKDPTTDERQLIEIDSLQYHYNELQKLVDHPRYQKCLLFTGELGSGKTYFLNDTQQWIISENFSFDQSFLFPLEPMEGDLDFPALILKAVKQRLGIQFSSIRQIHHHLGRLNRALDNYMEKKRLAEESQTPDESIAEEDQRYLNMAELEFIQEQQKQDQNMTVPDSATIVYPNHVRLFFALDDLSRWVSRYRQAIRVWMRIVKEWSAYHAIFWIASMPTHFYPILLRDSGTERGFWQQYGCGFLGNNTPTLDGWIVLDDLNQSDEVGLDILREHEFESSVQAKIEGMLDLVEKNVRLQRILCNPFNAITLTTIFPKLSVHTILDLNFIDIMDEFCTQQFSAILSKDLNILSNTPLSQPHLLQVTELLANFLSKNGNMSPPLGIVCEEIVSESKKLGYSLSSPIQAEFAIRVLATSNLLNIIEPSANSNIPTECLKFRFEAFWLYRIARILYEKNFVIQQGLEICLSRYDSAHVPGILEFLLLILAKAEETNSSIKVFEQVLNSNTLPKSSVWFAAAKTSSSVQKALLPGLEQEIRCPHNLNELHALLYCINELSYGLLPFDQVIRFLQPLYLQIKSAGLERFMIYIFTIALNNARSIDEIAQGMTYFTGLEIFDMDYQGYAEGLIANEVAGITVNSIVKKVMTDKDRSRLDEDCFVEVAVLIMKYLSKVNGEYTHKDQLPQPGKTWKRQLYREWVMYHFLHEFTEELGCSVYDVLKRLNWSSAASIRQNRLLQRQTEQELNIALGKLVTYGYKKDRVIMLVNKLASGEDVFDRRNAFHIIRHSVPALNGMLLRRIDHKFHPILEKLYFDPALQDIVNNKMFQPVFEQMENYKQLRNRMNPNKPAVHS